MTTTFVVKTSDNAQIVGQAVCDFNFYLGEHPEDKYSWIVQPGKKTKEEGDYWEIKGKYAPLKDLTLIALTYRVGDAVVLSEIDDDLASNFLDPLIEKYGFDNVKWIVVSPKR